MTASDVLSCVWTRNSNQLRFELRISREAEYGNPVLIVVYQRLPDFGTDNWRWRIYPDSKIGYDGHTQGDPEHTMEVAIFAAQQKGILPAEPFIKVVSVSAEDNKPFPLPGATND